MSTQDKNLYKDSLNLPQTAFAMEAKLVQNEPPRLKKWQQMRLYEGVMDARRNDPAWILHDGPPFANGDIHIGHLINKTLKDVVIRFRTMQGHRTPYVPGWDCHGLPIEQKIQDELGPRLRSMSVADVRQRCFEYAARYAKVQSEQFQRLGILGDWEHPYLTMDPHYEASTLEVFAQFVQAGLVYKKLKPVPWSVSNQTALADAELEYKDVEDLSVYVEFPIPDVFVDLGDQYDDTPKLLIVWTTTPWTLPANLAVVVHPDVQYAFVRYRREGEDRIGVVAEALVSAVFGRLAPGPVEVLKTMAGSDLCAGLRRYDHPFRDDRKQLPLLTAPYVTTSDGTGLVHTAPGHGEEDYETGTRHGLQTYSPVLANGRFDDSVPEFIQGRTVWEANDLIVAELGARKRLFASQRITHSYPHDWRSKKPIIFRATEQWFVAVGRSFSLPGDPRPLPLRIRAWLTVADDDGLQDDRRIAQSGEVTSLGAYTRGLSDEEVAHFRPNGVEFVPPWGRARLLGMLQSRPDWCISRQRAWGLPIPVFYNEKGESLLTAESVRAVARRFAEKGSNCWFTDSPAELLGDLDPGPQFPKDKLRKETDIFDVWFESGTSWAAVLRSGRWPDLRFPCDLYLEGSDQHRGWFQLSLLPSLGVTGAPPYKQVLTHGFVVKPDGSKVSKSDKEYVKAMDEINRHGADLLRLWCCSVDYQGDIPTSPQTIRTFGDKYRKIRNTLRYLLSNLYDYDPAAEAAPTHAARTMVGSAHTTVPLNSLDGWAMAQLDQLIVETTAAYDAYQLHRAFRLLHDFCAVQISAIYGNAMKDRLYCEAANSPLRRRAQAVMHRMVVALTKLLAPMVVFTADEAWEHIRSKPAADADLASVHLTLLPKPSGQAIPDAQREEWQLLMELRDQALLQLDQLKKSADLNKALDAQVVYHVDDPELRRRLEAYGIDLADMVGAGSHSFAPRRQGDADVAVEVVDRRGDWKACARSWRRRPDVGADPDWPDLTLRDAAVMRSRRAAT